MFLYAFIPAQSLGQLLCDKMIAQVNLLVHDSKIEIVTRAELGLRHDQVVPLLPNHYPNVPAARLENILFHSILLQSLESPRETLSKNVVEPRQILAGQFV